MDELKAEHASSDKMVRRVSYAGKKLEKVVLKCTFGGRTRAVSCTEVIGSGEKELLQ